MKLINGGKQSKKRRKGWSVPIQSKGYGIPQCDGTAPPALNVENSQSKYGNHVFLTGCDRHRKR